MDKFYCTKCYYLTSDATPPSECPVCHVPRDYFDPVPKNVKQFIPEYWNEHIAKKIEEIHNRQIQAGINSSSFALITDLHWATNAKHSAAILEKVMNSCGIPYFFNGGDVVSASGLCPASSLIRDISEFNEAFKNIAEKCLPVFGNHDHAFSTFPAPEFYVETMNKEQIYDSYFRPYTKYNNRVTGPDGTYCYADDTHHKMRYIALNLFIKNTDEVDEKGYPVCKCHQGLMQEQLDWLANVALDVPSPDWTVVVCSHIPAHQMPSNVDVALGICDAFRRHTTYSKSKSFSGAAEHFTVNVDVDFTGRGGNFAMWVAGHTHCDEAEYPSGILSTTTIDDALHNVASLPRKHVRGTTSEQAFDVFTVDKNNHKVYATRIGCGENREFEYEVF